MDSRGIKLCLAQHVSQRDALRVYRHKLALAVNKRPLHGNQSKAVHVHIDKLLARVYGKRVLRNFLARGNVKTGKNSGRKEQRGENRNHDFRLLLH